MSFQVTKQMAQKLGIQIYDWGIFILPFVGLQKTLSIKSFSSNYPI